jgi:hypothetical protein
MTKIKKFSFFLMISVILIFFAEDLMAVPLFPHFVYGKVKKDGANVPLGTTISALINGKSYKSTSAFIDGGESHYAIEIPGDDTDTSTKEGGVNGDTVQFMVGSELASQTLTFKSGETTVLDLNIVTPVTQYTLTISINPYNGGAVSKNPNKTNFNSGETVILTAVANSGYQFSSWSGDASGSNPTITLTMNGNKSVTANFSVVNLNQYSLYVSVNPSNAGYVSITPYKSTYNLGEQVTLQAISYSGYSFSNWSGDASGSTNPITINIDGNKNIVANFNSSTNETVTTPQITSGPLKGLVNVSYTFTTGGSTCSLNHQVQYMFDWGDGKNSGWLPTGKLDASNVWTSPGTYAVKARARCTSNPSIVSQWSNPLNITIENPKNLPMIGYLENPLDGTTVFGITTIHGWAIDGKGIKKVELFVDDQYICDIPYGSTRKDVQQAYPNYPLGENSGFGTIINYSLLTEGLHTIKVRLHNLDGETKDLSANILVEKFHGEFVSEINPNERWFYNVSVDVNGVIKKYDVLIQWSNETQSFVIKRVVPK